MNELVSQTTMALFLARAVLSDAGRAGARRPANKPARDGVLLRLRRDLAAPAAAWRERRAVLGRLAGMSDRDLADIGLHRSDVHRVFDPGFARNGEPFPFRVPGTTVSSPRAHAADTGSSAYPEVAGRPSWVALAGGPDGVPASGSEGTVETANSLPPGALGGTAAFAQGRSVQRDLAQQAVGPIQIARPAQVLGGRLGG